jgi:hypothetical protein
VLIQAIGKRTDETTTHLKVIVLSGSIKSYGKDYFTLSITSFCCFNTLYQMDENNSALITLLEIQAIIYLNIFFSVDCVGNPNVYDMKDELSSLLNGYISVTCNKIKKNVSIYKNKGTKYKQ